MKYEIELPDGVFLTKGVIVIEFIDDRNVKYIRAIPIHEPSTWDKIGLLRAAAAKEEKQISDAWLGKNI